MRIYIAGPYSAPTEEERLRNVKRAMEAALKVMERGHTPIVPHLSHYLHILSGRKYNYDRWVIMGLEMLEGCDGILRLKGKSKGATREVRHARKLGIPVYYSVSQIPKRHLRK